MDRCFEGRQAFIFPGAGMEYKKFIGVLDKVRMGVLREYCSAAKKEMGMDVWTFIDQGDTGNYDKELIDQAAGFVTNCAACRIYSGADVVPGVLLGYSMGIYSAFVSGGAVTFETGLMLIILAYEFMKCGMGISAGRMGVIMGMTARDVEKIISEAGLNAFVKIANENNMHSIVISGLKAPVERMLELAMAEGALRVIPLDVAIPYHSSFVEAGAEKFLKYLKELKIDNLRIPYISCINQEIIQDSRDLKNELYSNLKSRISWRKTVEKAVLLGICRFVETGMGDSLTRISRFIDGSMQFVCYEQLMKGA